MEPGGEDPARRLVADALDAAEDAQTVLIGGLGVGLGLDEALRHESVTAVSVVEAHPGVVDWNREHVGAVALDDPRVEVVVADLTRWVAHTDLRFDAICLTTTPDTGAQVTRLSDVLTDGGVLAVRSERADPQLSARLDERFATTWTVPVPVPLGEPDVLLFARDPR